MLGDRRVPPRFEAMLQRGAMPSKIGSGATKPHRHGNTRIRAIVLAFLHHGNQLLRGHDSNRPSRRAKLSIEAVVPDWGECVSPMSLLDLDYIYFVARLSSVLLDKENQC